MCYSFLFNSYQFTERLQSQLDTLRRDVHDANKQVEESIKRTLDATPLQNMNKYLDSAKLISTQIKQLVHTLFKGSFPFSLSHSHSHSQSYFHSLLYSRSLISLLSI
jgi:hypothetical protein